MNTNDEIEKITQETLQQYRMTSARQYLKDKEADNKLTSQYKGREIYELLQNIDDAAYKDTTNNPCTAHIEFDGDYLTVSNHGRPFTISTLQRLCQGGVSDKNEDYIGCKGIGFRSVLNWSDEIMIYSGSGDDNISVRFSYEYANSLLNDMLNSTDTEQSVKEHLESQINELERKGLESSFPIFRVPQVIEAIDKQGYDTVIRLKVRTELKQHIIDDIENIDRFRYILLFLPHITKIELRIKEADGDKRSFIYSKSNSRDGETRLCINVDGNETSNAYFCSYEEQKLERKYHGSDIIKLAVAIPTSETEEIINNTLYTFFPILDLKSPFPALLHATFFLTDNRNDLELNSNITKEVNKQVFRALLDFYIRTVVSLTHDERRIRMLQPCNIPENTCEEFHFEGSLAKLKMEQYFFEECRHQELFYSVNNIYLRGDDSPIVLDNNPGDGIFVGEKFSNVVKHIFNVKTRSFAKRISVIQTDVEEYLCKAIDNVSEDWDSKTRITVFKWWHSQKFTSLPRLLKVLGGKFLLNKEEPCFLSDDEKPEWVKSIPSWATISVLDDEDQNELLFAFKNEIDSTDKTESRKRVLARLIRKDLVDIQEQSSRLVVISPINSSVGKDFERAKEFIRWLWKVWCESSFDNTIKSRTNFVVPVTDGTVCEAKKVYFGSEYDNVLGEELFKSINGYCKLLKMEFEDAGTSNVQSFFKDLGVSQYPQLSKIKKDHVYGLEMNFVNTVLRKHPLGKEIRYYNTNLYSINNIEIILQKLDTPLIIRWIFSDATLKKSILNNEQPEDCFIEYMEKRKWSPNRLNYGWQLPSYMRFVFSNLSWININGQYRKPNELIITNNNYLNDFGMVCISENEIESYCNGVCSHEELRNLLILLGARTSILELESEQFYSLLLKLSDNKYDQGKAVRISRELYRAIIENSPYDNKYLPIFGDSVSKRNYRQAGKVLIKKDNRSEFIGINDAFFSSSAVINTENKYPIDVPARRGRKEDFEKILFIKPFDEKYAVLTSTLSECNDTFHDDLNAFIPCIMVYRKGRRDELFNITVDLVKDATISFANGKTRHYDSNYTLLKKANRHWLICVGKENMYQYLIKEAIADCLVRIFNTLLNFPSKEFLSKVEQLFIYSQRQREYVVEYEFGSIEEIDLAKQEICQSNDIKEKIEEFFNCRIENDDLGQINWNSLTTDDVEIIIERLKQTGKSLEDLSKLLDRSIPVGSYNKSLLQKKMELDKIPVLMDIYSTIKDCSDKHKELIPLCNAFESFTNERWLECNFDDINFDADETYNEIKTEFYGKNSICINYSEEPNYASIKSVYDSNVERLKQLFTGNELSLNDFTNNEENKSLLYFNDSSLYEYAEEFIKANKKDTANDDDIDKKIQRDIRHLVKNSILKNNLPTGEPRNINTGGKGGAVTLRETHNKERKNKKQGNIAEYLVVMKLVAKAFNEVNSFFCDEDYSIFWVSGAAMEIKAIDGDEHKYDCSITDDSAGYDIKLESKDKSRTMFIEVKSSTSENCSFFMSAKELETAKKKNTVSPLQQYRIIFVSGINVYENDCTPQITFIDAPPEDVFDCRAVQYNMVYNKEKFDRIRK